MRLLDLFCGAGGASMGYHRAGFDVTGVDLEDHPSYPFTFVRADARDVLQDTDYLASFDVLAASPPCQELTRARHLRQAQGHQLRENGANLIPETREGFVAAGRPYVIENVADAAPWLRSPIVLCGSMFGLPVWRHRLFESPVFDRDPWTFATPTCDHAGRPVGVYGTLGDQVPGGGTIAGTIEEAREAMGIGWMRWRSKAQEWADLKESIPPAYTAWIGTGLLASLGVTA